MTKPTETPEADSGSRSAADPSRRLLRGLKTEGPERDVAIVELHALLLGAARFEINRRRDSVRHLRGGDHEDLAQQSADDALLAVLRKLDTFRGDSRFTTWAYKFALLEAGVKMRRRAWQGREIPQQESAWSRLTDAAASTEDQAESGELLTAIRQEIERCLSPRQREVLVAVALNDVPIDVLAERLGSTRGALYKSLHDGRQKLRSALRERGLDIELHAGRETL